MTQKTAFASTQMPFGFYWDVYKFGFIYVNRAIFCYQ